MKSVFLIFIIISLCLKGYTQKGENRMGLTIENYKDTIKNRKDLKVDLILTNKSDKPIIISNRTRLYYKAIYSAALNDTINTEALSKEKGDFHYMSPLKIDTLQPYQSSKIHYILFEGMIKYGGVVKVKIFYALSDKNEAYKEVESDWLKYIITIPVNER